MITGDNSLTGSNIAYKCGIADRNKQMIIIDFDGNNLDLSDFNFRNFDADQDKIRETEFERN